MTTKTWAPGESCCYAPWYSGGSAALRNCAKHSAARCHSRRCRLKGSESFVSNEKRDRELGMNRVIPRRDFLNGMSLAVGASLTGPSEFWAAMLAAADKPYAPEKEPGYYPPSRTGMRGSHDGSWEVAHAMRDGKTWSQPTQDAE